MLLLKDLGMNYNGLGVGPKFDDWCPSRRGDRHTEKKAVWRWRRSLELCCHKPRSACNHQKLKEARKDSPLEPSESA